MKSLTPFVARIFLSLIFLISGIRNLVNFDAMLAYMAEFGVRYAVFFLLVAILILLLASLSLIFGYKARWGAGLLIVFLVPATLIFHLDFSSNLQIIQFLKNLGLIGGLMLIVEYGPGPLSFDNRVREARDS